MVKADILRKNSELAEIAKEIRIAKVGDLRVIDGQVKKLIEEILFLDKEPGCAEAVETVRANITAFYTNRVDELGLAESIEKLVEKLKENMD